MNHVTVTDTVRHISDWGEDDRDIIAAHVYRDRTILATVLIELRSDGLYHLWEPDKEEIHPGVTTPIEALRIADGYLAGFMSGYDKGVDDGRQDPRHDWPDADKRANDRRQRCCGGDPSCACEH